MIRRENGQHDEAKLHSQDLIAERKNFFGNPYEQMRKMHLDSLRRRLLPRIFIFQVTDRHLYVKQSRLSETKKI